MLGGIAVVSALPNLYKRHRFPPELIQFAVCQYYRFNISYRRIEVLLAERGVIVSYESIRLWCCKFGPRYVEQLLRRQQSNEDTLYADELFVEIQGKRHYMLRAVNKDGEVG